MKRASLIAKLKQEPFDLLVIGGGATGAGVALDAATRGMKVALVERDDFASGTSSRSTKLIHGGVRYLEQAVKKFDRGQFALVRDALHERATLLQLAPHLTRPLPLVTPLYNWFGIPYYRVGLKLYDWLAGKRNLSPSRYLSAKEALKNFPMLKAKGLRGGVLYYDGQFDDARMNVSLALTANEKGAACVNHVQVLELLKEGDRLSGAKVRDRESGESFEIKARVLINATGPFVDSLRKMDDPHCEPMLRASSGIHIILHQRFSPPATGLLIPKTEDGRVLFLLPWLGHTLVGTTDNPAQIEANPKPSEEDIQYIFRHLEKYFDIPVQREDVLAAWSGLRPLVSNPKASDTAKLSRDHVIHISPSGLLTITGGKWTTYRKMAIDAVDQAVKLGKFENIPPSQTETTPLVGAANYSGGLIQNLIDQAGMPADVAQHLVRAYGDRAPKIAEIARQGWGQRLSAHHPYLEAEVIYVAQEELAISVVDVLARRMRLTFLDTQAAQSSFPRVAQILAEILGWDESRLEREREDFAAYLASPSGEIQLAEQSKIAAGGRS